MNIDINTLRGLLTLALLILFVCLFFWAYSRKRVPAFNEAANLPFADEDLSQRSGAFSTHHPQQQPQHPARGESK